MSRIVSNLLTYQDYSPSVDLSFYENSLGDIAAISTNLDPVLKKSVLNSYSSGILTGYDDGTFSGNRTLTRGEAATVLLRIKDAKYRAKPKIVSESSYGEKILQLVNKERTSRGLNALVLSADISKVAVEKSKDMAIYDYFAHESPNYGSPFDMMHKFGITYRAAGENIAMGYRTPADVMEGWMNSPGHKANILNKNFNKMGIGMYSGKTIYWTQQFTD